MLHVELGNKHVDMVIPKRKITLHCNYVAQTLLWWSRVMLNTCLTRVSDTHLLCIFKSLSHVDMSCSLTCLCNITWQCHTSFECDVGCLSYVDIVSCYHSNLLLTLQTFHQSFPYFSLSKVYVLQSDCTHADVYFQKYLEVNPPRFNDHVLQMKSTLLKLI